MSLLIFKYDEIRNKDSKTLSEMLVKSIEANGGIVSGDFLADEVRRAENREFNTQMAKYTKWITIMTAIMLLATLVNVARLEVSISAWVWWLLCSLIIVIFVFLIIKRILKRIKK